jgi:protein-L-isoaspartate O-methyltransferase
MLLATFYEKQLIGKEYQKETQQFKISKDDKTLHIGCGAYPLTEITLGTLIGAHVVGIDNNPIAVQRAQQTIRNKNLQNKITIRQGDGINFPVKDYTVIILSSCSSPKLDILNHVIKTARPQTKIIVREIQLEAQRILEYIKSHNNIELVDTLLHKPFPFIAPLGWHSFFLRKK